MTQPIGFRTMRGCLRLLLFPALLHGAVIEYTVTMQVHLTDQTIQAKESIRFTQPAGTNVSWENPQGLTVLVSRSATGTLKVTSNAITDTIARGGEQEVEFEYLVKSPKGLHWLPQQAGVFSTYYCSAFLICSMSPAERASLRLEVVLGESGFRAAGPGRERKSRHAADGYHWIFETPAPVQTYLFSFALARLEVTRSGNLEIFAAKPDRTIALEQTKAAAGFFRQKTGVDPLRSGYREVFLPQPGAFGQEAAQLALLTDRALAISRLKAMSS
jgi:aminopeptidase N